MGTFSPEGNWAGLEAKLPWLAALGITTLEVMPVAEFAGRFGWGYDGVAWFAPSHLYGTPDELRRVVDRAHGLGLAVILDVVYNHFGVAGDYTSRYSPYYLSERKTEWGQALDYDGGHAAAMRALAIDNARYWIDEFHLDGLRLDATQAISDTSSDHIITALARAARLAGQGRHILLVAENEPQDARLLRSPGEPGVAAGLDALWNDDFHHSAVVALTGRRQAYCSDYSGQASEWLGAAKTGFRYQGQWSRWQDGRRGRAARALPMTSFVSFLENHDQIANSVWCQRLWLQTGPAQQRAMTALLLLGPWLPLLFQGQEWNARSPFFFFADHEGELAELVKKGRAGYLSQFPACAAHPELLRDPAAFATFAASRLCWDELVSPPHSQALALCRDLLRIRRSDPALVAGRRSQTHEVAILSPACGLIRYFAETRAGEQTEDRIVLVNLGTTIDLERVSEPLLAPPADFAHWTQLWSSEDPGYGGFGCSRPNHSHGRWTIPGCATLLLGPGDG